MKRNRIVATTLAALALVAGGAAVTTTVASASDEPRCYGFIVSDGKRTIYNRVDDPIGQVELWYNPDTGKNCVMTRNYLGRYATLTATLRVSDGRSEYVSGKWRYYSDGATLYAPGKCVAYSGAVYGGNATDTGTASRGFGNCG
ncbi:MAG: hypothetical protein ACRDT4_21505 [Micromonosporaceae bacterium]